jgi:hypothetical protein
MELLPEIFEPAERYSLPNPPHGVKVKAQVMQRVKGGSGHLAGPIKMAQIGSRKGTAGIAPARRIDRPIVFGVLGVLDIYGSFTSEELAISRIPGRHHAVEHVDAAGNAFDQIDWGADTH